MTERPGRRYRWWWPLRITFGLFFLHTALAKRELDERGKKDLHRFAKAAYPPLNKLTPAQFVAGMKVAETTVAGSLLVPVVPAPVGAAALTAFGAGLLGTYARVPGLRRDGSIRPTEFGLSIAKDSWMVAAGTTVLLEAWLAHRATPAATDS
jgi:hypothetical protein